MYCMLGLEVQYDYPLQRLQESYPTLVSTHMKRKNVDLKLHTVYVS